MTISRNETNLVSINRLRYWNRLLQYCNKKSKKRFTFAAVMNNDIRRRINFEALHIINQV